jgi:predicted tellurium resistance membrane protein TerC
VEGLFQAENIIALVTLIVLELVLGVDNVIFISILAGKLPVEQQSRARMTGISLAVLTRIALLLSLSWIISLEEPFFSIPWFNNESLGFSGRDIIMLAGGLFLLWKATHEIHQKLEGVEGQASAKVKAAFWSVIIQIMLLDIVFSLDSVITAVGMVDEILIMVIAVIIAAGVMIFVSGPLGDFVEHHPTIKMLALSFLLMIGFTLFVEAFDVEIPKGYIYFAMGFSVFVEMLNLQMRKKEVRPVNLRDAYKADKQPRMELAAEGGVPTGGMPVQPKPKKSSTSKPTKAKPGKKRK